jgi:hypothetical protein
MSENAQVFLITLTIVTGTFLGWKLLSPLMQALGRRLEGRHQGSDETTAGELEELRGRVRELEQHQGRMLELEERLDFTERLLVQARGELRKIDTPPEPLDVLRG